MKYGDLLEIKERGTPDFPIELYRIDSDHSRYIMPFHWHSDFEIIRVEEGEFTVIVGEEEYKALPGDVLLINSGIIHGGMPKDSVYQCVDLDTSVLLGKNSSANDIKTILRSGCFQKGSYFPKDSGKIPRYTDMLITALQRKDEGYRLFTMGALFLLFGEILSGEFVGEATSNGEYAGDFKMKAVLSWIEENYHETVTLGQLAEIAGMNPGYFCEFFKKYTRRSPIDYLNMYRIDSACRLFCVSGCSVTEAAFSCGFNDLSYFVKTFKKYKGVTPKAYRNEYFRTKQSDGAKREKLPPGDAVR